MLANTVIAPAMAPTRLDKADDTDAVRPGRRKGS
jgi:hypothetical protein